jgi:polysaccharide export outer membrane protein
MKPIFAKLLLATIAGSLMFVTGMDGALGMERTREGAPLIVAQTFQPNAQIKEENVATSRSSPPAYHIDTGDSVSITVYQEPDLSVARVRVKTDGTIAFPLLGALRVAGLTSQELQDLVTIRLLDGYLKKPSVSVSIDSYRLYFIKGEVSRPGGYSFVDGLTISKAVALAGGYTVRASQSKISLVREKDPDNPLESVGPNTPIRPGDIITVGESFF